MCCVRQEEDLSFDIYVSDFRKLVPLAHKTSVVPHIIERHGLPFVCRECAKKWSFYLGFVLFLFLLDFLSSFVWKIDFYGQHKYTKETLTREIAQLQVHRGMFRRDLDCDALEKSLRQLHPDISWVSAQEDGSVLKISIKEGKEKTPKKSDALPYHLTAKFDGVVESIAVNRGTAAVKKGDRVKKGDVLIRGIVPITDDGGNLVENQTVAAAGEVVLRVNEKLTGEIPVKYMKKRATGHIVKTYQIQGGKYIFFAKNPFKQLDNSSKYDIITKVCYDNTWYPLNWKIYIQSKSYLGYRLEQAAYTQEELKAEGNRRYHRWVDERLQAGMEILSKKASMKKKNEDSWVLSAEISFLCRDMDERAVSEQESESKKTEGDKNGESGENS